MSKKLFTFVRCGKYGFEDTAGGPVGRTPERCMNKEQENEIR